MSESVIPFYIPPSPGAGQVSLIRIQDPAVSTPSNIIELVVLSGGPVFGWTGNVNAGDAYANTHPAINDNVEFDFGANIYHCGYFEAGEIGTMSLCSDNESIGYLRISGKE